MYKSDRKSKKTTVRQLISVIVKAPIDLFSAVTAEYDCPFSLAYIQIKKLQLAPM